MILPIEPVCEFLKNCTFFRILESIVALLIDLIGAEFRLDLLHFLCKNQTPIWAEASPQGGYKNSVGKKLVLLCGPDI